MKLKQELGMLAGAVDLGLIPSVHWDYIYLYGELFSSKIFKHKLSYDFVNLLDKPDKYFERNINVEQILADFDLFKHDIKSNIENLSLEQLSTFDATSYHVGVKSTIWELPTKVLQKYRDLVTKEQWYCNMYVNLETGVLYFTDDKKEIGVVTYFHKKPERLF